MVIQTVSTLALYCSRCGNLKLHELSHFFLHQGAGRQFSCDCGKIQATVHSAGSRQYLLSIPCLVCNTSHLIQIDRKIFNQAGITKLYCPEENLELGFVGERGELEKTIAEYRREVDQLVCDAENDDDVLNPQIMFEVLNRVHDIAEKGRIYCHCGQSAVEADILSDCIELRCTHCGSRQLIPARTEEDLRQLGSMEMIEIPSGKKRSHKN